MPVMDGLTCARELRKMEKGGQLNGHVPIIAVTANARVQQIQQALGAGMDQVMTKPFRITELVPVIEGVLIRLVENGRSKTKELGREESGVFLEKERGRGSG